MHKTVLLLLFFLSLSKITCPIASNWVAILIHGTWGLNSAWHQPGNLFYETLKSCLAQSNIKLINFNWSGKLCYDKRQTAGTNLANLINSYPINTRFIIISHSHGGNVAINACKQLTQKNQIEAFYSLGLPIDQANYVPNMQVIQNFYHIFSFGDIHQTSLGMHERVFADMPNVYNINLEINHKKPQHEDLHSLEIAKWLLEIEQAIKNLKTAGSHFFAKFNLNGPPTIKLDTQIQAKLDYDKRWHERIHTSLLSPYSSGRSIRIS